MTADDNILDKIYKCSAKSELLEAVSNGLIRADKAVVILIDDYNGGSYHSTVMTLGLNSTYEAYGILEVGKQDLMENDY